MTSATQIQLIVDRDARLTGADDRVLAAIKDRLTLENPKYRDARKYGRWIGKQLKPRLYFFSEDREGLTFPRGFARQALLLCHRHGEREVVIDDRRQLAPPLELEFKGNLRPYQEEALAAVLSRDFGVLEAGTGSGKTVIACAVFAARRQPTLVLVHTKELLHQWAARIREFLACDPGLLGDGRHEIKPLTVAIVNSARSHLAELSGRFGQLCVDECHRVPATLFTEVVTSFDCRHLLGLSATAFRRDGLTELINFYLGESVHRIATDALQRSGAILKAELIQRPTAFRYVYRGNYQALIQALTADPARNRLIAVDIARQAGQENDTGRGTILVVSDRVQHCETLAALLAELGVGSRILTGATPTDQRAALVAALGRGEIPVLISTVQLIGEGFDCPGLDSLFLTTPIKFSGRLLQVVGRILRPAAGKTPRVYDYVDPVGVLTHSARARALALAC